MKRKHGAVGLLALAFVGSRPGEPCRRLPHRSSRSSTKVTLQLKWVTQAQFAGYYAALAQGYYKNAGLDVKIKIGGPSITPETVVVGKQAEFGLDWLPNLFATREKGSEPRLDRPGVRALGDDRADLEDERDQHDREDAGQEGRRLVLRQRAGALRRAARRTASTTRSRAT